MRIQITAVICLFFFAAGPGYALEPNQILVIANSDITASVQIAEYYCAKREVPTGNVLALPLRASPVYGISRDGYEKRLAGPIRKKLLSPELTGKIRCLLTTYGVPVRVGSRGQLKGREDALKQLEQLAQQEKDRIKQIEQLEQNTTAANKQTLAQQKKIINRKLADLQPRIDYIVGRETGASVDSELSMVLFDDYELYRWQPNRLKMPYWDLQSLMVCRLDGPGFGIIKGLVDKAITAERTGLKGVAYIDSRGLSANKKPYSPGYVDQSLRDLALMIKAQTQLPVVEERTNVVFEPNRCPLAALYCGWYSLRNYVDAFDFVDGAIGYHISSFEAVSLRDPNSSQWCSAMLKDGITATLGAVAEPYLLSFPQPREFFAELLDGHCLVEAYYRTKPFNSWQMVLIGDPLYRPFKKPRMSR